jgi:hypothetical protein
MLQVFNLDVAKVYLNVAYTCMLRAYVFKCSQVFHTYVYKCFIWMLHMFAMVFKCFSGVFTSVLDTCFKCFIYHILYCIHRFFCMLQLLHLNVSKVDRVFESPKFWLIDETKY